MESSDCGQLNNIGDNNIETIILTLPSQYQNADEQPSNSSLVRSECGQFFLVTYDEANKIVSKHQIQLQISGGDDFMDLKCASVANSEFNDGVSRLNTNELDGSMDANLLSSVVGQIEDRCQAGKRAPYD